MLQLSVWARIQTNSSPKGSALPWIQGFVVKLGPQEPDDSQHDEPRAAAHPGLRLEVAEVLGQLGVVCELNRMAGPLELHLVVKAEVRTSSFPPTWAKGRGVGSSYPHR